MINARFWITVHGSPVKITLTEARAALMHFVGGATEEGWSHDISDWSHDGATVSARYSTEGMDCDGRSAQSVEVKCPISELHHNKFDGLRWPNWDVANAKRTQRTRLAEQAGY